MVEIIPLKKIGEDERGATFIFDTDRTGEFIFSFRKAGSASGSEIIRMLDESDIKFLLDTIRGSE